MAPDERWVGVDAVAAHLGVGKDSIYRWIERRGLPARKVGRLLRFRLSEVDAWVEAGSGEGGGGAEARDRASAARGRKPSDKKKTTTTKKKKAEGGR